MDTKINRTSPLIASLGARPTHGAGDGSPRRDRQFVLPRQSDAEEEAAEPAAKESESGVLSPQPRKGPEASVSRVRLDDEVGQKIDLRG